VSNKAVAEPRTDAAAVVMRIGERVALFRSAGASPPVLETLSDRLLELKAGDLAFTAAVLRSPLHDDFASDIRVCSDFREFSAVTGLADRETAGLLRSVFGFVGPMLQLDRDPCFKALFEDLLTGDLRKATLALDVFGDQDLGIVSLPGRLDVEEGALLVSVDDGLEILRLGAPERRLSAPQSDKRIAAIQRRRSFAEGRYLLIGSRELFDAMVKADIHMDFPVQTAPWPNGDLDKLALLQAADETLAGEIDLHRGRTAGSGNVADWTASLAFTLEACLSLPHGLLISGWCFDPEEQIDDVVAVDYSLADPVLSDQWHLTSGSEKIFGSEREARRFSVFVGRKDGAPACQAVTLRLGLKNGGAVFVSPALFARDLSAQRAAALSVLAKQGGNCRALFDHVYHPALAPLQHSLLDRQEVQGISDFGRRSSRNASLLIPLYRDLSFIRSQLMAFAGDTELAQSAEIIFVVDDPPLADRVATLIEGAAFVYDLDLRVVTLKRNGGYAQANNVAASIAEGETLVLMNSDVVPEKAGWLDLARDRLELLPAYSAVGPKLLYADGSIQHVGMRFKRFSDGLWRNFHDWKGFARHFPPATVERRVDALTGACLVIRKRNFVAVGGFSTDYIGGDFEDSDLCLTLTARGGEMVCVPQAELYHFERQSIGAEGASERPESVYNRLLHTHRWNHVLETLGADA
jgi:GT2 family glycosyltransferase